jgi:hypothetical protein
VARFTSAYERARFGSDPEAAAEMLNAYEELAAGR